TGSTFTLNVPVRYSSPRSPANVESAAPRAGVPRDRHLVLAIDDDPNAIYLIRENLADAGHQAACTTNADQGVRKAHELKPFAITPAILMDGMEGGEGWHHLKADPSTPDVPVVVVQIFDNKDHRYHPGGSDYLLKPVDHDAI